MHAPWACCVGTVPTKHFMGHIVDFYRVCTIGSTHAGTEARGFVWFVAEYVQLDRDMRARRRTAKLVCRTVSGRASGGMI